MENCRNIFNISARHRWSISMENMDGDFERYTVLLYH